MHSVSHKHDVVALIVAGPSPSERESILNAPLKLEYMHLDLTSLDSAKHLAAQLIEKNYDLHLLLCTDAVINVPKGALCCNVCLQAVTSKSSKCSPKGRFKISGV